MKVVLLEIKVNADEIQAFKTIEQGSYKWFELRKYRLTGSNIRRSISMNSSVLKYFDKGFVNYGPKESDFIETAIQIYFVDIIKPTGIWIDHEFNWLGCSPDGIIEINGETVPVEIKCKISKLSISDYLKSHYYQIQTEIFVTRASCCLVIIYDQNIDELQFYIIEKHKYYLDYYLARAEWTYFHHCFKYVCDEELTSSYDDIVKLQTFKRQFLILSEYLNKKTFGCKRDLINKSKVFKESIWRSLLKTNQLNSH